ncbi:MAG: hypothetical protein ACREV4_02500 [Gammaproteobacteria bacterium]
MASDLSDYFPAGFPKNLYRIFARDITKLPHLLEGHDHGLAFWLLWEARDGLLIFRPEPGSDGFLDILQGFLFVFALGYATRQGWTFGNYPSVFGLFKGDVKNHCIFSSGSTHLSLNLTLLLVSQFDNVG